MYNLVDILVRFIIHAQGRIWLTFEELVDINDDIILDLVNTWRFIRYA